MTKSADDYLEKQKSPQKEIALKSRSIINKAIPKVDEAMKGGVPAYKNGLFCIVALKNHVNPGFSIKNLTPEERRLLQGSGKTMKYIE